MRWSSSRGNGISRLHRYACNVRRLQLQQLRQLGPTSDGDYDKGNQRLAQTLGTMADRWASATPTLVCLEAAAVPRVECVQ